MLRKIGFSLLCATMFIGTPCYSVTTHALNSLITIEYDLPPYEPQLFMNYMYWSVDAVCTVTMTGNSNLFIEALARKGKINNVPLSEGETINLPISQGTVLKLSADGRAKVQITNNSNNPVHISCSS